MLLHVLAEGYSERKFAEEMLAEWLAPKQLYVVARCVETHRDEKRGLRYSGGLKEIADQFGNPELIDNGPETAPSKRILQKIPEYKKTTAGVETLKWIGIENLKAKCSHFAEWLGILEGISYG